ncbi:hypothetical protein [Saccharothrix syringae]|uniref:Integrase n=1 Tax=Saccharothrix syringae TaxID=103733 RepID=A0A5Q0H2K9_SACSY|nr:hypothetical protein [Saccharothrix syringae]QFZ20448.1 hypothetical protein EKG83_26235 [Saccharothrix syringae]
MTRPLAVEATSTPADVDADPWVLPEALTTPEAGRGPRFSEDIWDLRPFAPRSNGSLRIDFACFPDDVAAFTAKEFLYSRLRHAVPTSYGKRPARLMKLTNAYKDVNILSLLYAELRAQGVTRLAHARQRHLDAVVRAWRTRCTANTIAVRIGVIQHVEAHGRYLSRDRLTIVPWRGRPATQVAGRLVDEENTTPRIPEPILAPLLRAALFYVQTASTDLLAAQCELAELEAARAGIRCNRGEVVEKVGAFLERRRAAGRGVPALPLYCLPQRPNAAVIDGVVQAPNASLVALMSGTNSYQHAPMRLMEQYGAELGYEDGGLDTAISEWPGTGRLWRPRLNHRSLHDEVHHLRTACWIVIAYLSGMRHMEVMELRRDCAFTAPTLDGRTRHKLRGRVFKGRQLSGDEAEWVVLDVVHDAVNLLLHINDDPTHLFGYRLWPTSPPRLARKITNRIMAFHNHVNDLFGTPQNPFIPADGDAPWTFTTRQFRRTLAWHIAHQPYGVVAGARQYHHAKLSMFEGYAGTSASGFASEVAAEEAVAALDYVEDLYRDWNGGARTSGAAAQRIDAEFERIRRELGDLPGTVADEPRLRTMLVHLTKTLHPGVLNDCFFNAATAMCVKRATIIGRPVPQHNMCLRCSNARRSTTVHLPRLTLARGQAAELVAAAADAGPVPQFQQQALDSHLTELDHLIAELDSPEARP